MNAHDLMEFRQRMGWSQQQLANQLQISKSRIQDYEAGWTRGAGPRRAPIPYLVELACETLERRAAATSIKAAQDRGWDMLNDRVRQMSKEMRREERVSAASDDATSAPDPRYRPRNILD
jgi:predicted transcriptional regulator